MKACSRAESILSLNCQTLFEGRHYSRKYSMKYMYLHLHWNSIALVHSLLPMVGLNHTTLHSPLSKNGQTTVNISTHTSTYIEWYYKSNHNRMWAGICMQIYVEVIQVSIILWYILYLSYNRIICKPFTNLTGNVIRCCTPRIPFQYFTIRKRNFDWRRNFSYNKKKNSSKNNLLHGKLMISINFSHDVFRIVVYWVSKCHVVKSRELDFSSKKWYDKQISMVGLL